MPKAKDLTGEKIGKLKLTKRKRENNRTYYFCECDCGNKQWMRADSIVKGCGCVSSERAIDIKDKKFNNLTALEPTNERDKHNGSVIWKCRCECGNIKNVSLKNLRDGTVRSCGCLIEPAIMNNLQKAIKKNLEENLVEGTSIALISNVKSRSDNTSGVPGVTWVKNRGKWSARITFKGEVYHLGTYTDKEKAIKIRKEAEERIFGGFLEWYYNKKDSKKK